MVLLVSEKTEAIEEDDRGPVLGLFQEALEVSTTTSISGSCSPAPTTECWTSVIKESAGAEFMSSSRSGMKSGSFDLAVLSTDRTGIDEIVG